MLTAVAVRILREEYDAFVSLIPEDEGLPRTYDEWLKRSAQENANRITQGYILNEIVVHPKDFAEYCGTTGQKPSYFILQAFAVRESSRQL